MHKYVSFVFTIRIRRLTGGKALKHYWTLTVSVTKPYSGNRFPFKRIAIYFERCLC